MKGLNTEVVFFVCKQRVNQEIRVWVLSREEDGRSGAEAGGG